MIERSLFNYLFAIFRCSNRFCDWFLSFQVLVLCHVHSITHLSDPCHRHPVNLIYFIFFPFSCWFNRNRFESRWHSIDRTGKESTTRTSYRQLQFSIFHIHKRNTFMTSQTHTHSPCPLAVCMCQFCNASKQLMKWLMSRQVHFNSFMIVSIRSLTSAVRFFHSNDNDIFLLVNGIIFEMENRTL